MYDMVRAGLVIIAYLAKGWIVVGWERGEEDEFLCFIVAGNEDGFIGR